MIWLARVSSTKPISAVSEVFFTSCTRKPTVGATLMRMACGRTTWTRRCAIGEAQRRAGLPLPLRDRLQAAAPDLAEEGRGVDRQRQRRGGPGVDRKADERQAEEEDEQLAEQRRALDQVDVADGEPVDRPDTARPAAPRRPGRAARRRPWRSAPAPRSSARPHMQVDDVGGAEFADHRRGLLHEDQPVDRGEEGAKAEREHEVGER